MLSPAATTCSGTFVPPGSVIDQPVVSAVATSTTSVAVVSGPEAGTLCIFHEPATSASASGAGAAGAGATAAESGALAAAVSAAGFSLFEHAPTIRLVVRAIATRFINCIWSLREVRDGRISE